MKDNMPCKFMIFINLYFALATHLKVVYYRNTKAEIKHLPDGLDDNLGQNLRQNIFI